MHSGGEGSDITRDIDTSHEQWNKDSRDDMTSVLIQTSVDLTHVVLLQSLAEREERERLRVKVGINTQDVERNSRRGSVVARTDDVAITDDDDELPLVVVLEARQRVNRLFEGLFTFSVARHLADDKFVVVLGGSDRAEMESAEDCPI